MRIGNQDRAEIVYSQYLTQQGAAILATQMHIPPAGGAFYRFNCYLETTNPGTGGVCAVTLTWDDDSQSGVVATSPTIDLTVTGFGVQMTKLVECAPAGALTFATSVSGIVGAPKYMLVVVLERLK